MNADYRINQRAFTSNTANGAFNFDRWNQVNSGGTFTVTPQTFTPGSAPVAGYEGATFLRGAVSGQSAAGDYAWFSHKIESVRTLAGQASVLSFWAKASTGTPAVALELSQNFGDGGSPSSAVNTYVGQVTLSTSWTRYSVTVTVPSISGKTLGTTTDGFLRLNLMLSAGSDYNARSGSLGTQTITADFWGWQLEAGSVATPFNTMTGTLAGEFLAASRYFTKSYNSDVAPGTATATGGVAVRVNGTGVNNVTIPVQYKVTMRATPTVTIYSGTGVTTQFSNDYAGTTSFNNVNVNNSGMNGFNAENSTTATSLMMFHYTASAEL